MRYGWAAFFAAGLAACQTTTPAEGTSTQALGDYCQATMPAHQWWQPGQPVEAAPGPSMYAIYATDLQGGAYLAALVDPEEAVIQKAYVIAQSDLGTFAWQAINWGIAGPGGGPGPCPENLWEGDECGEWIVAHIQVVTNAPEEADAWAAACQK